MDHRVSLSPFESWFERATLSRLFYFEFGRRSRRQDQVVNFGAISPGMFYLLLISLTTRRQDEIDSHPKLLRMSANQGLGKRQGSEYVGTGSRDIPTYLKPWKKLQNNSTRK